MMNLLKAYNHCHLSVSAAYLPARVALSVLHARESPPPRVPPSPPAPSMEPLRAPALHLQRDIRGPLHEGVDLGGIDAQPQRQPVHRLCAAPRLVRGRGRGRGRVGVKVRGRLGVKVGVG